MAGSHVPSGRWVCLEPGTFREGGRYMKGAEYTRGLGIPGAEYTRG